MTLLMLALALTAYGIPIEVNGWSYSDDPVYLVFIEMADSTSIAISSSPEELEYTITNYVDFPGMFNPPKVYASYEEETRGLSVYSQYPYSANYFLATYRFEDDGYLALLDCGGHDAYLRDLEEMRERYSDGDSEGVLDAAWSVMYPGGNPYGREMCLVLLQTGLAEAEVRIAAGADPSEALEWIDEADNAAWNLAGVPIFQAVLAPAEYPEDASIPMEEYVSLLEEYAGLLDLAGSYDRSEAVRTVAAGLTE